MEPVSLSVAIFYFVNTLIGGFLAVIIVWFPFQLIVRTLVPRKLFKRL